MQASILWTQLVGFGPPDFPAYARLRFIPDPTEPGQKEADVNIAYDHPSDMEQTQRALDHLRSFTATPEDCYCCVWEGHSDAHFRLSVLDGPMVTIPNRRYFLFHGSLTDLAAAGTKSMRARHMLTSRQRSPGRLTTVGASPATSTPTGPESEPSKQRSTHSSTPLSSTSSQLDQPSLNPPTTN
jgi:hypothetical protein